MRHLDLTLSNAAENLALDEALLEEAEAETSKGDSPIFADTKIGPVPSKIGAVPSETLRLWEPREPVVVVGRSSRISLEVSLDRCRELGIPILRRISGGAAVVAGPGCLMYGLVLSYQLRPRLRVLSQAHRWVLDTLVKAIGALTPGVQCRGTSDLAIGELKFSGNSVRCRRNHLLYHGTLLYDFPLPLIGQCLTMPPRTPDYRAGRSHEGFVTNLPLKSEAIRDALKAAFDVREPCDAWPKKLTAQLVAEKYSQPEWNEGIA
jgi:lipoate-protein ligase A